MTTNVATLNIHFILRIFAKKFHARNLYYPDDKHMYIRVGSTRQHIIFQQFCFLTNQIETSKQESVG